MTVEKILAELKALGDEKTRAMNARQGVGEDQFGVKLGDLRKIAKRLKTDHARALELLETGNFEARMFAGLLMKPNGLDLGALLDRIEAEMPAADPFAQWTMNWTLGTIGIHHAKHRKRAVAIGEKIGLYSDWPVAKGCTPPFVPVWVAEMVRRQG